MGNHAAKDETIVAIIDDDHAKVKELITSKTENVNAACHQPDGESMSLLAYACKLGHVKTAAILLGNGADFNQTSSEKKFTPLHFAASNASLDCVQMLIARHDIDVNAKSAAGETALSLAGAKGDSRVVEALLTHTHIQHVADALQNADDLVKPILQLKLDDRQKVEAGNSQIVEKQRVIDSMSAEIGILKLTSIDNDIRDIESCIEGVDKQFNDRTIEMDILKANIEKLEEERNALKEKLIEHQAKREAYRKQLRSDRDGIIVECPVCLENMQLPKRIYQCTHGHVICSDCRPGLTKCPVCRVKITRTIPNLELERMVNKE